MFRIAKKFNSYIIAILVVVNFCKNLSIAQHFFTSSQLLPRSPTALSHQGWLYLSLYYANFDIIVRVKKWIDLELQRLYMSYGYNCDADTCMFSRGDGAEWASIEVHCALDVDKAAAHCSNDSHTRPAGDTHRHRYFRNWTHQQTVNWWEHSLTDVYDSCIWMYHHVKVRKYSLSQTSQKPLRNLAVLCGIWSDRSQGRE